jgi:hypothetical protein
MITVREPRHAGVLSSPQVAPLPHPAATCGAHSPSRVTDGNRQSTRVRSRIWLAESIHDRWPVRLGNIVTHRPMLRVDLLAIEDPGDPLTVVEATVAPLGEFMIAIAGRN